MSHATETTKAECSFCGEPLEGEESDNSRLGSSDGQPVCDECWHEHFEFTCCRCCEYGDVEDQHNLLVVFETVSSSGGPTREIEPGIYRIKSGAYFGGPLIGEGYLLGGNLERIADVNPDMDGEGYPCGHLCLECQQDVLAQFAGKCSLCLNKSLACLRVKLGSWKDVKARKYQWTRAKIVCAACRNAHKGAWKRCETIAPRS